MLSSNHANLGQSPNGYKLEGHSSEPSHDGSAHLRGGNSHDGIMRWQLPAVLRRPCALGWWWRVDGLLALVLRVNFVYPKRQRPPNNYAPMLFLNAHARHVSTRIMISMVAPPKYQRKPMPLACSPHQHVMMKTYARPCQTCNT